MKRSTERILTTHVGSLVRPLEILEYIIAKEKMQPYDKEGWEQTLQSAVKDVVRKQAEAGIDVPSDGEYSKAGFSNYINDRIAGLERREQVPEPKSPGPGFYYPQLQEEFPGFMAQYNSMYRTMWLPPEIPREGLFEGLPSNRPVAVGELSYAGHDELNRDLENFRSAMEGHDFEEAFVPAATPNWSDVEHGVYDTPEAYLYAMADALHDEYKAIVDAGFLVQLDLGLPARNQVLPGKRNPTPEELRRASEMQVEAYNHALRDIPTEKVRYHLCWGSMNTPHTTDVPLKEIVDLILKIDAQAYSIEAANPRHEHEWMVWKDVKLPEGKILIPGVVTHSTNVVEHPELVAWRIKNYASVVGRENVIAGTDCGFAQGWTMTRVHEEVQWAKLRSLAEGAALASEELWK